jgi:glycosyltransferase involved in cell wall biosynthesis
VKQIDPDIVHGQGTERDCAIAAVLSGRPNVLTIHGNMRVHAKRLEYSHQLYYKIAAALEGFCLRKTDGVVAISRYTEDLVKPLCARTWLLPNAVDRRFFNITPVPPEIPRFLVVGSIGHRKNPIGLIETCEDMLSAGRCTIAFAGDGEHGSDYYRAFEQKLKTVPNLELLGFLDRDELAAEFARSTAVILPTFEDNCPMVVLEGMAAGLPVAASRVGGVPDLIEHDVDGLMFDPHRPADMKSVLEALATDCGLRQRLGAKARETATHRFHPRVSAGEHLRIYREVLSAS